MKGCFSQPSNYCCIGITHWSKLRVEMVFEGSSADSDAGRTCIVADVENEKRMAWCSVYLNVSHAKPTQPRHHLDRTKNTHTHTHTYARYMQLQPITIAINSIFPVHNLLGPSSYSVSEKKKLTDFLLRRGFRTILRRFPATFAPFSFCDRCATNSLTASPRDLALSL